MTQPRVVLHLGFHKTGTSFLQECIFPHLHGVNVILSSDLLQWEIKPHKLNIISCEALSKSIPHYHIYSSVDRFVTLELLHSWFPDAQVVVATRDQQSRLRSCYAQYVKNCGSLTFEKYIEKYNQFLSMSEYVERVRELWRDVFIFSYDDFKNRKFSVIRALFVFLDISDQFDDVVNVISENSYVNKSPGVLKVRGWRFINSLLAGNVVLRRIRRVINGLLLIVTGNNKFT